MALSFLPVDTSGAIGDGIPVVVSEQFISDDAYHGFRVSCLVLITALTVASSSSSAGIRGASLTDCLAVRSLGDTHCVDSTGILFLDTSGVAQLTMGESAPRGCCAPRTRTLRLLPRIVPCFRSFLLFSLLRLRSRPPILRLVVDV